MDCLIILHSLWGRVNLLRLNWILCNNPCVHFFSGQCGGDTEKVCCRSAMLKFFW